LIVQPDVLFVAVSTYVVADVSVPLVGTDRMFHLPETSARLTAAGAAEVVEAVDEAIALLVSTAAFSFLAHPARAAAPRQIAMRVVRWSVNIEPPVTGDGRLSQGVVPSQTNVRPEGNYCK